MEPVEISQLVKSKSENNIWLRMADMITKHNPLNLGRGFPGSKEFVPQLLHDALIATQSPDAPTENDQYPRSQGHPLLVKELANLYSKLLNRPIDSHKEIVITVGGDESIHCIMQGIVNPGEEVILFTPLYTSYVDNVLCCGAVPKFVPLKLKPHGKTTEDFYFDKEELRKVFSNKTKAIIVNSPHNPTGKVFTDEEIIFIADLCKTHNCLYFSDEVYYPLQYGTPMLHAATLPGMWERTITLGSAGKFFCVTGWKTGWSIGPSYLINAAFKIHFHVTYNVPTPIQIAVSEMVRDELSKIGTEDSYWLWLRDTLQSKRDRVFKILQSAGLNPVLPSGGYFILANLDCLDFEIDEDSAVEECDERFVNWMIINKGVLALPCSDFYSADTKYDKYLRFCFIKSDADIDILEERMGSLRKN